jgi:hypothetical protein
VRSGALGDIPVDGTTVYVDQSYDQGAGPSDGTEDRPYTSVGDAVVAAPAGGLIAIAPGSYVEDVVIQLKPVRLWGKCPAEVELVGTGAELATVYIRGGATGSELAGLAIRGLADGVLASGAESLELHGLWVHGNAVRGIDLEDPLGPVSAAVSSSLIEGNHDVGIFVAGSEVELEGVVVRDTLPEAFDQTGGRGINIRGRVETGLRSSAVLRASLIEDNHDVGVFVAGSDAELDTIVVRGTLPRPSDQTRGRGINIQDGEDAGFRSSVVLRGSLIEHNHELGVFVAGSDAELEAVVVRDTLPRGLDQTGGRGITIENGHGYGARSSISLRASLIERNHDVGVFVAGSDAELEGVLIRDTLPLASEQTRGRGINIQVSRATGLRSSAVLRGSLIERNHDNGVVASSSDARLLGVSVVDTQAQLADGLYGDGVVVGSRAADGMTELSSCHIAGTARAGLAVFGGVASVHATALSCNTIHLASETSYGRGAVLTNAGHNRCWCGEEEPPCTALSVGLEPPEAIDPIE